MAGIWYSSTDSVLISSEKYINKEGEYVEPPVLPEFSVMSQSDFYKTYGKDKDWEAFLANEKEAFAKEQEEYKKQMESLTVERKDIGRFYTPILCPNPEIVSSEPQGRKFYIPPSLFDNCSSLSLMKEFETEEENFKEGEPNNDECTHLPFHYLYCKTAVDFLLWRENNKEVEYKDLAPHLREILLKNYGEIVTEEELKYREKTKEQALSFQRENCNLVDNFRMTDRYNLLYEISLFLGSEDLRQASGYANAEAVRGFTPKDFRIQLDKPDIPMEEKLKIYEKLSWLNEKDIEIN